MRYYLMPLGAVMQDGITHRYPKYLRARFNPSGLDCEWTAMDFGAQPLALVRASAEDISQPDVYGFPVNLHNPLGEELSALVSVLTAHDLPADWLTPQMRWAQVVRHIAIFAQYAQAEHGQRKAGSLAAENRHTAMKTHVAHWQGRTIHFGRGHTL